MLRSPVHLILTLPMVGAVAAFAQSYESYQLYLGSYPEDANCGWHHDAQGVAHDDDHWFITQTQWIWRIPVERDLWSISASDPDVLTRSIGSYPELAGYTHFGDPDVYRYDDMHSYLVMPIEHEVEAQPGAIAVFRCNDLSYVAHFELTNQDHDAGWCAAGDDGLIYSSVQHPGFGGQPAWLQVYGVDWSLVPPAGPATTPITIVFQTQYAMTKEDGNPLELVTMQGGEFAPGDGLLYLISGFHDDDDAERVSEGIHLLDTTTWRRVAHSTNGYGHFNYYYNPGSHSTSNEPEGLTVWDLDDGRAPGIRGQLHAFMLDNDWPDDDDIYLYHYTNIVRVDASSSCENGTPACPFITVSAAVDLSWDGSEIRIRTGTYDEPVTISKRIRLTAEGGVARIGG